MPRTMGKTKTCTQCNIEKNTPEFPLHRNICKQCVKLFNRNYYLQHNALLHNRRIGSLDNS